MGGLVLAFGNQVNTVLTFGQWSESEFGDPLVPKTHMVLQKKNILQPKIKVAHNEIPTNPLR